MKEIGVPSLLLPLSGGEVQEWLGWILEVVKVV
jgi:hypothetical protein